MTIKFVDKMERYYGLVKVRFSKYFNELIEFQSLPADEL